MNADSQGEAGKSSAVLSRDTSREIERLQVELWRRMSPLDKAQAVGRVSQSVRELALAGIRQRHPSASEGERHWQYALLTLGRTLASKAYTAMVEIPDR